MWLMAAVSTGHALRNDARDASILDRLSRGDADAMADLYDRHGRAVYSLALRILQEEADAEDVVHEVFVHVWEHAARYSLSLGTVPAWLLALTRVRALARLRARRPAPPAGSNTVAHPAVDVEMVAMALTPDEAVSLRTAVEALPILQRLTVELAYFEGLTQRAIAERLDVPLGMVTTRIRSGLLALRDAVNRPVEGA